MQKISIVVSFCNLIKVVGPQNTGKTSLLKQFVYGKFYPNYEPTIEDTLKKEYNLKEHEFNLIIFDTPGQEEYESIRNDNLKNAQAIILVYSIDSYQSFLESKEIYEKFLKQFEENDIPIIVVGNKNDLEDREVSEDEAREWVQNTIQKSSFIETSSKKGLNVNDTFKEVLKFFVPKEARKIQEMKDEKKDGKERRKSLLVTAFEKLTKNSVNSTNEKTDSIPTSEKLDVPHERKRKSSLLNVFTKN